MKLLFAVSLCLLGCVRSPIGAQSVSPLFERGYTVLPTPQKVELGAKDVELSRKWRLQIDKTAQGDIAVDELSALLAERYHFRFGNSKNSAGPVVRLAIAPDSTAVTGVNDKDKTEIGEQAYRLTVAASEVTITGNSSAGLLYGVQTFAQLVKEQSGKLWVPEVKIQDWPDLPMRIIYWDDAHHLEHMVDLKAAIRQASFYKINGFSIKLEGHFQYQHAPAIVDPYALSPSELQELTNYALKYHVQLIPYLDGPAHDAFILKHPEYSGLREFPESNYEFCTTNPKTYELLEGMFDDLLEANKGGKYFVLSTDEAYYVGLADSAACPEAQRAKQLGSVGKLLSEFVTKTAGYLHEHGRTVIFWGEYPLKPDDIGSLPNYLINGEVYGSQFDLAFRAHGIRQMVYTSTEGEEQLFPRYYVRPTPSLLHGAADDSKSGRVQDMLDSITFRSTAGLSSTQTGAAQAGEADLTGVFVAGWADAGLHPETFWLGYATGPAAGWNRHFTNAEELRSCFYTLFYGRESRNVGRLYQLMSEGAQAWEDSWDKGPSSARKPIWGESYGQFHPPQPAHDQFLPPLPVSSPDLLRVDRDWSRENETRLKVTGESLAENDELLDLLYSNMQHAPLNRYNLSVLLSVADLYRQNLRMVQDLGQMSDLLKQAQGFAAKENAEKALEAIDRTLDMAAAIRNERNRVLQNATETWYESWYPRVDQANGRTYLNEVDDVKDHQPMRTVDMSYLVYRELLYPMNEWAEGLVASRNAYAKRHGLPPRDFELNWKKTS